MISTSYNKNTSLETGSTLRVRIHRATLVHIPQQTRIKSISPFWARELSESKLLFYEKNIIAMQSNLD